MVVFTRGLDDLAAHAPRVSMIHLGVAIVGLEDAHGRVYRWSRQFICQCSSLVSMIHLVCASLASAIHGRVAAGLGDSAVHATAGLKDSRGHIQR